MSSTVLDKNSCADLATFALTKCETLKKKTSLLASCLYRDDKDATKWHLTILAEPGLGVTRGRLTRVMRVEKTVCPLFDPSEESEEREVAMNNGMSGHGDKRGATPATE